MSVFSNNYLMNIEKPKIKNKNKQNKYIASKPNFLMTSNTYKYFQDKELNNKNINIDLTTNTINYPFNKDRLTSKNSKKYFKNFNNDENKENMKNKYNTNNTFMNNKNKNNKSDRTIFVNKFHNINSNKKNIDITDNNNFKKLKITQKKKERTLSSNLNKIIDQNFEKSNAIKTYRKDKNKNKENKLLINDLIPTHKKSKSIILSQNNPNLFQSKSFCFDELIKQRQTHKNNSVLKNIIINQQNNNNKSIFNNTSTEFYSRLKQIIPNEENNNSNKKIKEYKSKESFELNKYINMNKSFTSSNLIKNCGINQYQNTTTYNINETNNININNYMSLNKNKRKQKTKSITSLTNINLYLNKSKDTIFTKKAKNKENHSKILKKILKIDSCTIPGYSLNGIKQKNLDAFFLKKNFLDKEENFFIGICDGHGIYGDLVSKYISQNLPLFIKNTSKENIIKSFIDINKSLIDKSKTKIDCSLSGCTCTSLIVSLEKIMCANIGNTRAILSRYENGYYNSINLNRDHKPTESDEIKRIISQGGEIKQSFDKTKKKYFGPERIWLKNSDIPGLSMSRSFGDNLAHTIGVINIPEINCYEFTGTEKFIVIASESIWQFIDSDECVEIIKEFYEKNLDAIGALNALVTEAIKRWKKQENKIEDITAVVIFFE